MCRIGKTLVTWCSSLGGEKKLLPLFFLGYLVRWELDLLCMGCFQLGVFCDFYIDGQMAMTCEAVICHCRVVPLAFSWDIIKNINLIAILGSIKASMGFIMEA